LGIVLELAKDRMHIEPFSLGYRESDVVGGSTELLDTVGFDFEKAFSFIDEHRFSPGKTTRTIAVIRER
jgi:hypothetical protein